jgi:O-antigen/teichoic acid export membrane protein
MKAAVFAKDTLLTVVARVLGMALALLSSILIARSLGPEGIGVYTLAILFPMLMITFTNLGLGPATVYFVAQDQYSSEEVLGNNTLMSGIIGAVAIVIGLMVAVLFHGSLFPTVPLLYLILALMVVPANLFGQQYVNQILLGARRIKEFNAVILADKFLFLLLVLAATVALGLGVAGTIWAGILSSVLLCLLLFLWLRTIAGGVRFRPNLAYLRDTLVYGVKAHLGNVIGFLNYRIEVLLLGVFLPASAVGFYSVAVGLAEKLWFLSESASIVLFPTVAAEKDEQERNAFTPLVSRNVLLVTAVGGAALFFVSQSVIVLLYSWEYLPTVQLFRILLPGIVFLSAARILANDIAGRGKPLLNTYVGGLGLLVQVGLNLAWIPRFGAAGSAWATTIAYGIILVARLWLYMKVSGNSLAEVIVPRSSDVVLYRQLARLAWRRVGGR